MCVYRCLPPCGCLFIKIHYQIIHVDTCLYIYTHTQRERYCSYTHTIVLHVHYCNNYVTVLIHTCFTVFLAYTHIVVFLLYLLYGGCIPLCVLLAFDVSTSFDCLFSFFFLFICVLLLLLLLSPPLSLSVCLFI